jgi:peptide/nickel transport system substrate-binding protein
VPLVDGRSIRSSGNPNTALLADPTVVAAVDEATAATDPARRNARYRAAVTAAMTAASYAPLVEDRALLIGGSRLRNAYVHPAYHGYDVAALGVG